MEYQIPEALFDGNELRRDLALMVAEDRVVDLVPLDALDPRLPVKRLPGVVAPGLFDVQVNGGGGVMLNNAPTPEGLRRLAEAHNAVGTAYLLPTVITDHPHITARAAEAVLALRGQYGILGIHIEGPHINPRHKGTHNPAHIRPFDDQTLSLLERLRAADLPVLLTLAPELAPPGLIAQLTRMGVKVSAGHTAATAEQAERALAEGLRCFTHLFNGMPQMTSRAPMITGAAINSAAWCSIIADGHHVSHQMVALACRARPQANRMILVSDAMSTIGGPDHFEIYGEVIRVQDGRLINAKGSLAGAHISLHDSVSQMVNDVGLPIEQALHMATAAPAEMMDLPNPGFVGRAVRELARFPNLVA